MNAYGCLYCCLPACQWDYTQPAIGAFEAREIQALYTGTILPKMAAHQQVLLVPGTFGCTNLSAVGKKAPLQTAPPAPPGTLCGWPHPLPPLH